MTDPLLQNTVVDSNLRQSSDFNQRQNSGSSLLSVVVTPIQIQDEHYKRNVRIESLFDVDVESNQRRCLDEDNIRNRRDPLLPTICRRYSNTSTSSTDSYHSVTESIEPSISREASSKILEVKQIGVPTLSIQRTNGSISITDTEKRESSETNSHRLPSKPDSSFLYSIRDDPTSTFPGKRYKYADIKLKELRVKTWSPSKPTIVQLADAGFFQSGDTNMAICFSCGNKIYCNEGQDPLHEAFHKNCEYLRQITITSTQLKTACSPDQ